jgi:hypothetical protein
VLPAPAWVARLSTPLTEPLSTRKVEQCNTPRSAPAAAHVAAPGAGDSAETVAAQGANTRVNTERTQRFSVDEDATPSKDSVIAFGPASTFSVDAPGDGGCALAAPAGTGSGAGGNINRNAALAPSSIAGLGGEAAASTSVSQEFVLARAVRRLAAAQGPTLGDDDERPALTQERLSPADAGSRLEFGAQASVVTAAHTPLARFAVPTTPESPPTRGYQDAVDTDGQIDSADAPQLRRDLLSRADLSLSPTEALPEAPPVFQEGCQSGAAVSVSDKISTARTCVTPDARTAHQPHDGNTGAKGVLASSQAVSASLAAQPPIHRSPRRAPPAVPGAASAGQRVVTEPPLLWTTYAAPGNWPPPVGSVLGFDSSTGAQPSTGAQKLSSIAQPRLQQLAPLPAALDDEMLPASGPAQHDSFAKSTLPASTRPQTPAASVARSRIAGELSGVLSDMDNVQRSLQHSTCATRAAAAVSASVQGLGGSLFSPTLAPLASRVDADPIPGSAALRSVNELPDASTIAELPSLSARVARSSSDAAWPPARAIQNPRLAASAFFSGPLPAAGVSVSSDSATRGRELRNDDVGKQHLVPTASPMFVEAAREQSYASAMRWPHGATFDALESAHAEPVISRRYPTSPMLAPPASSGAVSAGHQEAVAAMNKVVLSSHCQPTTAPALLGGAQPAVRRPYESAMRSLYEPADREWWRSLHDRPSERLRGLASPSAYLTPGGPSMEQTSASKHITVAQFP